MTRKEERIEVAKHFENSKSEENINTIADFFRCGAEWADKTMLDRVEDFLRANLWKVNSMDCVERQKFVTNFRKAMEE